MVFVNRLHEEKSEEGHFHVPTDAHDASHMPPVDLAVVIDSQETALIVFSIVYCHLVVGDEYRLGDGPRLPVDLRSEVVDLDVESLAF